MDIYTVSLFGHRYIDFPFDVEEKLYKIIYTILNCNESVEFLIGRNGEFDEIAARAIKRAQRETDFENSVLTLVLPYVTAELENNKKSYVDYYDNIEICEKSCTQHFKKAFEVRNKNMIDRSNLVVCYIEKETGGAYTAYEYARDNGIDAINIGGFTDN